MGNLEIANDIMQKVADYSFKVYEAPVGAGAIKGGVLAIQENLEAKDLSHQKVVEGLQGEIRRLTFNLDSAKDTISFMKCHTPEYVRQQLSEKDARIKELQAENGNLVNSLWSNSQLVPVKIAKFEVLESLADELAWALVITHDCATYRGDGECDGCLVSRVLTKHTSWKGGKK